MKRSSSCQSVAALLLGVSSLFASATHAALLHHFDHSYLAGAVDIDLDVFDGLPGGKYLWRYTVRNKSFDPSPPDTNGFSGFELFLPSPIPEIADITAPPPGIATPGWETNCCSGLPLEWDIRNSDGLGLMPGETGEFSFTTDPRLVAINDSGWFHSWIGDSQITVSTTLGMHVPLVPGLTPIAEPGSLSLMMLALAGIGVARKRKALALN